MKKKILFVINPISGTGRHQSVVSLINETLDKERFDYKIVFTKAPKHATELAREAVQQNYNVVVAVGGDGTMHEVGKGLIGSKTAMAIFPRGSGNGMARNMNIPMKLKRAIKVLEECKTVKIDTVSINNEKFIGIAGLGFDALIAWEFAHFGKRGFQSYVRIVLREFAKYKCHDYDLIIDGKTYLKNAFLISFANSAQWGNNAIVSPKATINDGIIDVCVMKEFPAHLLPILAMRLFSNTMDKSRYMEIIQGKEVIIKQHVDYIQLDGDTYELGKELHIKVNPKSLNMVVPGFRTVRKLQNIAPKISL